MSANYKKLEGNVSHGWDFVNAMIMAHAHNQSIQEQCERSIDRNDN